MEQIDYNEERQQHRKQHRKQYAHLTETVKYASACEMLGDSDGEQLALRHGLELMLDLLMPFIPLEGEGDHDGVELDGMRAVSRALQDFQETGAAQEEGAPQAHVVPVVQVGDAASGEVLTLIPKEPPEDSRHGTNGINPKRGVKPRKFRLYSIDEHGNDIELVDEGTAAELAARNDIGPSTVYKKAGKEPAPGSKWRVEKVR